LTKRRGRQPFMPVDAWGYDEPYLLTSGEKYALKVGDVETVLTPREYTVMMRGGMSYTGIKPSDVDRWAYSTMEPDAPMPHLDWEWQAFQEGGWQK
jgi:hypothetical protein